MKINRRDVLGISAALPFATSNWGAEGGSWPSRPITIVVAFAAGGQSDSVARMVARRLEQKLGQPVIVDNRPGANSLVATQAVLRAPADGYTLLFNMNALVTNPILLPNVRYDGLKDFMPVARIFETSVILAAARNKGGTLAEFLSLAQTSKEPFSCGTVGHASSSHYYLESLARAAGVQFSNVPYKGGDTQMLPDLVSERLQAGMVSSVTAMTYGADNRIVPLAATGIKRWKVLPHVPTFLELGYPGLTAEGFCGLFAPAGTPTSIVERINAMVTEISKEREYFGQMLSYGLEVPPPMTTSEYGVLLKKIYATWRDIKDNSAIRIE
ncbi:tripartite tricarboxylate transporter substrate binding protein [Pseudorhodoferax sp. Leaf265]|uniref:Bug family tripartite tricarboxylate transporter substrate binding protein n=1 Tax=Pseudorhodoferax sp. Leaf265 TaxID=1736315 RepID=UPI0006F91B93|nr:tripartite tricarboxylate transporter substrate binding protein [Pseudorhodoferax sp. Leaf265]KQP19334.1 hypothetical protein ASF45_24950 [Pseudorhodoferax sp. Leaf265]